MTEEIRRPGYMIKRDDTPKMEDFSAQKFQDFRKEVNDRLDRFADKINTIEREFQGTGLINKKPTIMEKSEVK